jgi:hypothetical protein
MQNMKNMKNMTNNQREVVRVYRRLGRLHEKMLYWNTLKKILTFFEKSCGFNQNSVFVQFLAVRNCHAYDVLEALYKIPPENYIGVSASDYDDWFLHQVRCPYKHRNRDTVYGLQIKTLSRGTHFLIPWYMLGKLETRESIASLVRNALNIRENNGTVYISTVEHLNDEIKKKLTKEQRYNNKNDIYLDVMKRYGFPTLKFVNDEEPYFIVGQFRIIMFKTVSSNNNSSGAGPGKRKRSNNSSSSVNSWNPGNGKRWGSSGGDGAGPSQIKQILANKNGTDRQLRRTKRVDYSESKQEKYIFQNYHDNVADVTNIYYVTDNGERIPWLIKKPSKFLLNQNVPQERAYGLFANKTFSTDDILGIYVGKILGRVNDKSVTSRVNKMTSELRHDAIIELEYDGEKYFVDGRQKLQSNDEQIKQFGKVLLDSTLHSWPGAFLHFANDPKNSKKENVRIQKDGTMLAKKNIEKGQEIFWTYGGKYWEKNTGNEGRNKQSGNKKLLVLLSSKLLPDIPHSQTLNFPMQRLLSTTFTPLNNNPNNVKVDMMRDADVRVDLQSDFWNGQNHRYLLLFLEHLMNKGRTVVVLGLNNENSHVKLLISEQQNKKVKQHTFKLSQIAPFSVSTYVSKKRTVGPPLFFVKMPGNILMPMVFTDLLIPSPLGIRYMSSLSIVDVALETRNQLQSIPLTRGILRGEPDHILQKLYIPSTGATKWQNKNGEKWFSVREKTPGVYAERRFNEHEFIARLVGRVQRMTPTLNYGRVFMMFHRTTSPENTFVVQPLVPLQTNEHQIEMFGKVIIDYEKNPWPGAPIHLIRDAEQGKIGNVYIDRSGNLFAGKKIEKGAELFMFMR